jgi:teichuronic acid biosynthesis glycosyltransferase TuaC
MDTTVHVLMITSEWPTPEHPELGPFIVRQADFLRSMGIKVDVFAFRGSKSPLNYIAARRQVRKKLRTNSYDLVHAQFGQSGLLIIPQPLPLVVTYRGSDLEGIIGRNGQRTLTGRVLKLLSKVVALAADEIIVVSESLGQRLPRRCKYRVIPSGLDLDLFRPMSKATAREALQLPQDRRLVLFGGLASNARKRHDLARQAVALLDGQFNADLIVMSSVPHDKVPLYMNACDALLLTSLHEGSPNVVKEALACNLPVVSVDVGDVRERLDAVPGCVVCRDDQPQTIAAGLAEVLNWQGSFNGRAAVESLDERLVTQQVIDVYHRAMQRRGRQREISLAEPQEAA